MTAAMPDAPVDTTTSTDVSRPVDMPANRPDGLATSPLDQACRDFAVTNCVRLTMCEPFVVRLLFGDACQPRMYLLCMSAGSAKDISAALTPAAIQSCTRTVQGASCADIVSGTAIDGCLPSGTRPADKACAIGTQCASGYCRRPPGTGVGCGTCAARMPANGKCDENDQCERGLVCTPGNLCVKPVALGSACSPNVPCQSLLTCTTGICVMPATTVDSPCIDNDCSGQHGLYCARPITATRGTCRPVGLAGAGGACGFTVTGPVFCAASGTCDALPGAPSGRCVAAGLDNQECQTAVTANRGCLYPVTCGDHLCRPYPALSCF